MHTFLRTVLPLLVLAAGCGGKVIFTEHNHRGDGGGGATGTGVGGSCDNIAFVDGQSCASEGQKCVVPHGCCSPIATCFDGVWSISEPECDQPCIDCGEDGPGCSADSVCVTLKIVELVVHQCREDPCPAMEGLNCACAMPLCADDVTQKCTTAKDSQVACGPWAQ
jgi:hypothetical protein